MQHLNHHLSRDWDEKYDVISRFGHSADERRSPRLYTAANARPFLSWGGEPVRESPEVEVEDKSKHHIESKKGRSKKNIIGYNLSPNSPWDKSGHDSRPPRRQMPLLLYRLKLRRYWAIFSPFALDAHFPICTKHAKATSSSSAKDTAGPSRASREVIKGVGP